MNHVPDPACSPDGAIRAFTPVVAGHGEIRGRRRGFSRVPLSLLAGDGTVREVAQELADTDVALGVIPIGTVNIWAAEMNIRRDVHSLVLPLDQAPVAFWQLAFPLPGRAVIERHSRAQSLDPFLIAALIRQESEFNVKVVSYANAYGLMQLVPATGRELARHAIRLIRGR